MKYLYSILIILTAFVALPSVIDYSTSFANHEILYAKTGSFKEAPEMRKARDMEPQADNAAYAENERTKR
jgi:hypothetical protein